MRIPKHLIAAAKFGYYGLSSATKFAKNHLHGFQSRGLWAGMAAHSIQPLTNTTSAFALLLLVLGHDKGWPFAKGGSQKIADALIAFFISIGGKNRNKLRCKITEAASFFTRCFA